MTLEKADITDFSDADYATTAQGALADSAVQPGDLSTVATTGLYSDLSGTPVIPSQTSDLTNDSGFITDAGVTQIVAGTNVTISPVGGTGVVTINATGSGGGGATAINDLTDVTITAAVAGEVLRYNGSVWSDAQLDYSDLSGTPALGSCHD